MPRVYFRYRKAILEQAKAARSRGEAFAFPREVAPRNGRWYLDYIGATGRRLQPKCHASTKGEAEGLLMDLVRKADRLVRGLEVEGPGPVTFGEACRLYRESIKHLESYKDVDAQLRLYLEPALGKRLMSEVTPADCDSVIQKHREALAPATLKALLLRIGAVYRWAENKGQLYAGRNPARQATPVRVPERVPRFLTEEQLRRLLNAETSDVFVHFFAVLTGLRKGEVAGLKWEDMELGQSILTVRRSYDKSTTKGKKDRLVPIPDILARRLRDMAKKARSPYVFPNPKGGMRTEDGWDAAQNFKAALRSAGLVKGYTHKCRRTSCLNRFESPASEGMPCPKCGFTTWPVGIPLDLTFKDLRSTYGTHLAISSRDIRLVQRLLGHSRPDITERAYVHTTVAYLQEGVKTLPLARDNDVTPAPSGVTTQDDETEEG